MPRLGAVLVAGIDIAAAHAGHDVDEVKFHHAGDVAPHVLAEGFAFLALDFQEHAGGQGHLVAAGAVVAVLALRTGCLPLVVGSGAVGLVGFHAGVRLADSIQFPVCGGLGEEDVAGQIAQVVHYVVDTKVVAVLVVGVINGITIFVLYGFRVGHRHTFVERHLIHTVNGVVLVVHNLGHTVLCTPKHHAAAEHAAHVGSLDGVHGPPCIDAGYAEELPLLLLRLTHQDVFALLYLIILLEGFVALYPVFLLVFGEFGVGVSIHLLALPVVLAAIAVERLALVIDKGVVVLFRDVHQAVVGLLAWGKFIVILKLQGLIEAVVVSAVVVDVQFAEAIDQRQVALAVDAADVVGADGDEIDVIDIAD